MKKIYEPVIGLEVHVELKTNSKMFCGCPADHFGKEPNTQTCPVCLGLPGALPVPNKKAIEWCIKLGLALHCTVPAESKFDRKNYFYPDLPKGYQISQYDKPLCENGWIQINDRKIRIRRVHQEEDTGKLQHIEAEGQQVTLVDFNRSGVPLVEIVTEPDFHTIDEVDQYVKQIRRIIRYLDISNADMEKGSMRLEPSISLRVSGSDELPNYRVELKNINSFRFVRKAIEFEIKRQSEILDLGETIVQQTRGWNESKQVTLPQREKEEAHDYRYFPEPDIPPMRFTNVFVEGIRKQIPELPDAKKSRFMKTYNMNESVADILIQEKELGEYFEKTVRLSQIPPVIIANALVNQSMDIQNVKPEEFINVINKKQQEKQVDTGVVETAIEAVIASNAKAIEDYKKGKVSALMFLIGMVKRELKGKGDATTIEIELKKRLA
ncbi:MAG: Aspartyl/glutamyl-tRNA(Asn/Gln) amidotransferase subunit B [Microgenomates group bacterium GW2011_GWC1_39_12]|nr:MAG: Aspartyl/glutamyl-tRNA(Asn/Gln) amidotransferase subunit B [Microgenomates group bacterium GW2011_GWC1_39_12]